MEIPRISARRSVYQSIMYKLLAVLLVSKCHRCHGN